jgi:hypothetical protein
MQLITRWEGMRSIIHCGFGSSGWVDTQLSRANSGPGTVPPHISTERGSVYGALCGRRIIVPSNG